MLLPRRCVVQAKNTSRVWLRVCGNPRLRRRSEQVRLFDVCRNGVHLRVLWHRRQTKLVVYRTGNGDMT